MYVCGKVCGRELRTYPEHGIAYFCECTIAATFVGGSFGPGRKLVCMVVSKPIGHTQNTHTYTHMNTHTHTHTHEHTHTHVYMYTYVRYTSRTHTLPYLWRSLCLSFELLQPGCFCSGCSCCCLCCCGLPFAGLFSLRGRGLCARVREKRNLKEERGRLMTWL